MVLGDQRHAPAALHPGEIFCENFTEGFWVPDPVSAGAENLATTGRFDPRTVQPVVSRYTDYNIPTHFIPATTCFNPKGYLTHSLP